MLGREVYQPDDSLFMKDDRRTDFQSYAKKTCRVRMCRACVCQVRMCLSRMCRVHRGRGRMCRVYGAHGAHH